MVPLGSLPRSAAFALALAGAMAVAAPLSAAAQQMSEHCLFLQERIERMKGDIVALQNLVSKKNVLMKLTPEPGQSLDEARNAAYKNYFTLGTWYDAETRSMYIVVSRDFMVDYFQMTGASKAALQQALTLSDGLRDKVQYGGEVESLQASLAKWQQDFTQECGGSELKPPPPPENCLLGVCPDD
ncbi:MAG: hypothetical protein KDJ41_16590 [Hyphomicrobiaceae bacterium]|nr:hypothetical protein [Hyphomicrobiaceae bacterium]